MADPISHNETNLNYKNTTRQRIWRISSESLISKKIQDVTKVAVNDKDVRALLSFLTLYSMLAFTHIHQRRLMMNLWDSLPACLPTGVHLTQVLGKP